MRFAVLGFFIMSSLVVHAQEADCETQTEKELKPMIEVAAVAADETTCPNRKKFKNFCMMIGSRTLNDDAATEKQFKYMYQKRLLDAGCVDLAKDSEQVKAEKIQKAWKMYEDDLKCNASTFDIRDGHVVKYAISDNFDEFIDDVIKFRLNLNKVDASDGMTVLDYIKFHINRTKGTALESKYQSYYDKLKAAGAKHKSEL